MLYCLLEQEKKMFEKTQQSRSLITNPVPLWYSYSSAFASTTLSMRVPLWFVCSIWTVWIPSLKLEDIGRIVPSPDPQGAALALLSALDLPEGVTPAMHVVALSKWIRELVLKWNKDRSTALGSFSLDSSWEEIEEALAHFYVRKLESVVDEHSRYRAYLSSLVPDSFSVEMP